MAKHSHTDQAPSEGEALDKALEKMRSEQATAPIEGEVILPANIRPAGERTHKATFASDNRNGGYMIRVEGPDAEKFAKRQVPVSRYDGTEVVEALDKLIWTGPDAETGKKVALYKFVKHPKAKKDSDTQF